jgi:transposase
MSKFDIDKDTLAELRGAGYTIKEIAKKYGVANQVVGDACRLHGVHGRRRMDRTLNLTKRQLQALYDSGMTTAKIAEDYDVQWKTVKSWADKLGVSIKAREARLSTEALQLKAQGYSYEAIAKMLKVSQGWVASVLYGAGAAPDAQSIEDNQVSLTLSRFPEAPDMSYYADHWSVKLARRVLIQACLDLWSGTEVQQQSAADFFSRGHFVMWAWLTGNDPGEVYKVASDISKRKVRVPGDARPKNFGIVLD